MRAIPSKRKETSYVLSVLFSLLLALALVPGIAWAEGDIDEPATYDASVAEAPEYLPVDVHVPQEDESFLETQDEDTSDEDAGAATVTVKNLRLYDLDGSEQTLSGDYDCEKRFVIVGRPTCPNTQRVLGNMLSASEEDEFADISFLVLDVDGNREVFVEGFGPYETDRVRLFSSDSTAYSSFAWWAYGATGGEECSVSLPFTILINRSNKIEAVFTGVQDVRWLCRTYLSGDECNPDGTDPGDPDQFEPEVPDDPNAYDELSFSVWGTADSQSGRNLLSLVNDARAAVGVSSLNWDVELEETALQRAAELMVGYSHTRPNGRSCFSAWPASQSAYAGGENIAMGQRDYQEVNTDWTHSPGHYANMINGKFTTFAAAHFQSKDGKDFWVECFGGGRGSGMTGSPTVGERKTFVEAIKCNVCLSLEPGWRTYSPSIDEFFPEIPELAIGEEFPLELVAYYATVDSSDVIWSTNDADVAAFYDDGFVTGVAPGTCVASASLATYPDLSASATVTVGSGTQQKPSGTWGSCPWEIDRDGTLWVYPGTGGECDGRGPFPYSPWYGWVDRITSIKFVEQDGQKVVAPDYSGFLCGSLTNVRTIDLSGLDISQATDLGGMFMNCGKLNTLDLSGMDTSNVQSMFWVFRDCTSLQSVNLSGWDTSQVYDMDGMFAGCQSLTSLDLTSFDTSGLSWDGCILPMFEGCYALAELRVGPGYTVDDELGFPDATASNGKWWSAAGQQWMTKSNIVAHQLGTSNLYANYEASANKVPAAPQSLSGATIANIDSQTYTGRALTPSVTVKMDGKTLVAGTDYTVSYANNTNAGTAQVNVTGKGAYTGSQKATFTISPASIAQATFATIADQTYTGQAIKPTVTVKLGDRTLVADTDYQVGYKNNTQVGTATVTATGKGNYTGSASTTFKIVEKPAERIVFSDVRFANPGKTAHCDDIQWLADQGISKGWKLANGTYEFRGSNDVVRQDMAAFLYRLAGNPTYTPSAADKRMFADVNEKTPHAKEIWWLAKNGISKGWEVGGKRYFRGEERVKRQDMAAFLRRLGTYMGIDTGLSAGSRNPFSDVTAKTPHREDVLWLASSGVSAGWTVNGHKEFRGDNTVKRQDMAAFLHRLYNLA